MFNRVLHFPGQAMLLVVDSVVVGDRRSLTTHWLVEFNKKKIKNKQKEIKKNNSMCVNYFL
jgi:hypothetical protein